jgi:hypothetical protein
LLPYRATGETRALNFNGLMLVMGGGRTAPIRRMRWTSMTQALTAGQQVPRFLRSRLHDAISPPTRTAQRGFGWRAATIAPASPWPRWKSSAQRRQLPVPRPRRQPRRQ